MNKNNSDVLVVGGGIAACVAAAAVREEGKKVTMLFSNGGNTEICGGAFDILGVVPGEEPEICDAFETGIDLLLEKYPNHIYKKTRCSLSEGIKTAVRLAGEGGYDMYGFDGRNVWVPNIMGTFTVNAYVPEALKDSVLVPGKKEKVLVVGIKGNVAFHASSAAVSYQKYQKKLGGKAEYYSTEIALSGWGDRRKISDGELADYLDTEQGQTELLDAVTTFCRNNRYHFDKILFPPALGYLEYASVIQKIREACGCAVGEVETLGNSVVGYRLTRALYRGLVEEGVDVKRGTVVKEISVEGDRVVAQCLSGITDQLHPGEKKTYEADSMILATGGFVGGGIRARKTEVWIELLNQNLGQVGVDLLDRDVVNGKGQDFIRLGVEVDEKMAVADEAYKSRIYACGNLLAGQNFASERSGVGVAVSSAYMAAKSAAASL
ncbi:MAG: FAD-binding protein [Eubacteriales bacterium]|nr:FAD-binding protein [Eubacteriales bacterium]